MQDVMLDLETMGNGPNAAMSSATIAAMLKEGLDAKDAVIGNQVGDARSAIAGSARKIEAVYSYPFQNHATMETMNATVRYTPQRCEVWTPTQNGEAALAAAADPRAFTRAPDGRAMVGGRIVRLVVATDVRDSAAS